MPHVESIHDAHPPSIVARFWPKAAPSPGGCWVWSSEKDRDGYGRIKINGRRRLAHRVSYEISIGPIPEGLQIDHLCRNRACVNPAHLEAVTSRENTLRGEGVTAQQARRTHCPHGHAYDETNTRVYAGRRFCRECNRRACRERRLRIKGGGA